MTGDIIHDRGRGPEIVGTRITVYNLLTHFLDPTATEGLICRLYDLTPEQVSAARAYVLNHADPVLSKHLEIEARMAAGNPPEVIERAKQTHATFLLFKDWLRKRQLAESQDNTDTKSGNGQTGTRQFPSFREWVAEQELSVEKGP